MRGCFVRLQRQRGTILCDRFRASPFLLQVVSQLEVQLCVLRFHPCSPGAQFERAPKMRDRFAASTERGEGLPEIALRAGIIRLQREGAFILRNGGLMFAFARERRAQVL